MATVSVLIPAYNEEATIIELLGCVARQRIEGVKFEVVVVDDGSSDGTLRLLEENPRLYDRLVKISKNSGKGAAVKAGLSEASGKGSVPSIAANQ